MNSKCGKSFYITLAILIVCFIIIAVDWNFYHVHKVSNIQIGCAILGLGSALIHYIYCIKSSKIDV